METTIFFDNRPGEVCRIELENVIEAMENWRADLRNLDNNLGSFRPTEVDEPALALAVRARELAQRVFEAYRQLKQNVHPADLETLWHAAGALDSRLDLFRGFARNVLTDFVIRQCSRPGHRYFPGQRMTV